jgi:predicted transposase YdaD
MSFIETTITEHLYNQGGIQGEAQGKIEGKAEGKMEGKKETAINLLRRFLSKNVPSRLSSSPSSALLKQ